MGRSGQQVRATPRIVVGAKSVRRALDQAHAVRRVLVAADAPGPTVDPVRRAAAHHGLAVLAVDTARELGRRCGIDRPVAAAAELDRPAPNSLLRMAQGPGSDDR